VGEKQSTNRTTRAPHEAARKDSKQVMASCGSLLNHVGHLIWFISGSSRAIGMIWHAVGSNMRLGKRTSAVVGNDLVGVDSSMLLGSRTSAIIQLP